MKCSVSEIDDVGSIGGVGIDRSPVYIGICRDDFAGERIRGARAVAEQAIKLWIVHQIEMVVTEVAVSLPIIDNAILICFEGIWRD